MKPPRLPRWRYWCVLLVVAMVASGCRQAAEKPGATPKTPKQATESVASPEDPAPAEKEAPKPPSRSEISSADDNSEERDIEPETPKPEDPKANSVVSPPATEPVKPDAAPDETEAEAEAEDQDKPAEPVSLGPPLGEDVAKLVSLQPNGVVWIDKENRRVIAVGQVCQRNAPLEMFACSAGTKEHEAVVSIPARAMLFHTALLAVGAKPGKPVQFNPKYVPASGTEIAIEVRWKDASGKIRSARAQEWIRNASTKKPMEHNWVFGGSTFWTDERTGHEYYSADGGDLICVSNFPSAMLDLPIESSQKDSDLMFQAFTENIPELGTPVTIILKPKLE